MCQKAYKRISLLTKLKYIGVKRKDLLDIYKLFIRSCLEYATVVFHSSLTQNQSDMLEAVQKLCLKIILSSDYEDYESSLQKMSILSLNETRNLKFDKFCMKSQAHPIHTEMFPISTKFKENTYNI